MQALYCVSGGLLLCKELDLTSTQCYLGCGINSHGVDREPNPLGVTAIGLAGI